MFAVLLERKERTRESPVNNMIHDNADEPEKENFDPSSSVVEKSSSFTTPNGPSTSLSVREVKPSKDECMDFGDELYQAWKYRGRRRKKIFSFISSFHLEANGWLIDWPRGYLQFFIFSHSYDFTVRVASPGWPGPWSSAHFTVDHRSVLQHS